MWRTGQNLSITSPSCLGLRLFCFLLKVAHLCDLQYLLLIQIRCRNPRIAFAEKGCRVKVVKRKWKIGKNNKEQVQFTTLWHNGRLPRSRRYEEKLTQEKGIFRKE